MSHTLPLLELSISRQPLMTSICFLQAGMHRLPEAEVKK